MKIGEQKLLLNVKFSDNLESKSIFGRLLDLYFSGFRSGKLQDWGILPNLEPGFSWFFVSILFVSLGFVQILWSGREDFKFQWHHLKCSPISHINFIQSTNFPKNFSLFQVWINQGDIILIGLRDYQDSKADVIFKYTPDEARSLKSYGEFPESVRINDTVTFVEEGLDDDIEFGDEGSSSEDEIQDIWSNF